MLMRWTHLLLLPLLLAAVPSALAYPPSYRKSSGYYYDVEPSAPFIPSSPQEVIWHPSPFIPPHDAGPPLRADSYRVPRPRRDSTSAARSRRGSYVPPALPPHQPFPRPPLPQDEFGRPPLPHRRDSLRARPAFPGAPARSRSRSGSVDPEHLPPGFQPYASSTLHAYAQVQHTPFGPVPAPFQPPVRGHSSIPVHPSLAAPNAFGAPPRRAVHEVNPFVPPVTHHPHVQESSPNPFIPPPPHASQGGGGPLPVHRAVPRRNDASWRPKSEAPHPAAGHPLYEKYKNPNYGMRADAHIDAYRRPPHARMDVQVAKAPYEGNPLGLTMPGHWDHPAGYGGGERGEGGEVYDGGEGEGSGEGLI